MELWIASVEAAGLDPASDSLGSWKADMERAGTARYTIRLDGDRLIQYEAFDGGADGVGWQGTWQLIDADTIEATDIGTTIVYDFTLRDDVLAMDVISDSDASDLVPQVSIYETLPFTRVP